MLYGAILGDIIGSPYEFDQGDKTKDFPLFSKKSYVTDDSIMTIAISKALTMEGDIKNNCIDLMSYFGKKHPYAGYGARFRNWFDYPLPYGSLGNGSAMRVGAVGWLYDSLEKTKEVAKLTAEVSHNHIEGIKGAQSVACAMFLLRNGYSKEYVKEYIEKEYNYDLSRTLDDIRPTYHHVETCMETVPEAFIAFLEATSFEDTIRNAVSLGGDTDTLACIAGSIAEAYYEIPSDLVETCKRYIKKFDSELYFLLEEFNGYIHN